MSETKTISIYSDYVCPYCLLAEQAIRDVLDARGIRIRWRPFELRPDPVPTLRVDDSYLPDVWKRSVYPMAERLGLPITLPSISPQPRSDKAFQVFALAEEHGLGHEYSVAVMRAFFLEGKDIGESEVLADIAASLGLDRQQALSALADGRYLLHHQAALRHAVNEAHVRSVPTIIVGNKRFSGVPDLADFQQALNELLQFEQEVSRQEN
ncbi:DsbA family protein [Chromobacterium sp. IIBBL 290-4]|uniref:DsbA family oxidoreductase n=1 Tax=Chromobacterium sp. IIBBL 290-4 TaxID=2953890 RepID=UPI0020B74ACB|nr:DsbA family oxidoreductase [Chromobacterium sp. IIBBL 290-4]UTH72787.1 DsbA family oxidoreductase [Chromobacterium sp. IIBBL 290-4]